MKGLLDRTKVVLRHLPPTITQSMFMEHIDSRFSGRYHWLCFRPGKSSQHQLYSKAYINFNAPEDVLEFAEFFDGHVFVNEKGTQFKVIVEYAPSQRVPKQWSKKDGREGSILKDPQYLEFLEILEKPVENLPSAEIQLERKEADRAGAPKDAPIVTPLMDFIRKKRAAISGPRRLITNGKLRSPSSGSMKRGPEKKTPPRYVTKGTNGRQKQTYVMVPKRDIILAGASGATDLLGDEKGDIGKKTILLLKGNEKEIPNVTMKSPPKQNQRGGGVIRSILNRPNQNQSFEQVNKDKRLPRPPPSTTRIEEKRINTSRNRDRPDRGVWTPRLQITDQPSSQSQTNHGKGTLVGEGKPVKKGFGGHHEKKMWVQKSTTGS